MSTSLAARPSEMPLEAASIATLAWALAARVLTCVGSGTTTTGGAVVVVLSGPH